MGLFITIVFLGIGIISYVVKIKEWYESRFDWRGFNKNSGIHRNGTPYDDNGFDKNGYDKRGFNVNKTHYNGTHFDDYGYDIQGYNKDGYDRDGYDKRGFNVNKTHYNGTRFDDYGYDIQGYNKDGYDRDGYDRDGYNKNGYNRLGKICNEYDSDFQKIKVFIGDELIISNIYEHNENCYYVPFDPSETKDVFGRKYHTYLDCFLSWSKNQRFEFETLEEKRAWHKVTREYILQNGLKKCWFCESRDKPSKNIMPPKTLTSEVEKHLITGKKVLHKKFGVGNIDSIDKSNNKIKVVFGSVEREFLLLTAVNYLEIID